MLDLNGHSLQAAISSPLFDVQDGGQLTLRGTGSITNQNAIGQASNGGEIVIEAGTYTSTGSYAFAAGADGSISVEGGTVTGSDGAVYAPDGDGSISVSGGTLEGTNGCAIATNESATDGSTINITGGTMIGNIQSEGYEAVGVYLANADTFTMNDGEILAYGGTGLCMRAGSVTISGGSIGATGVDKNGNTVADGKIGSDNTVMTGVSGIIYHQTANNAHNEGMQLTISGGEVAGVDHAIQVLSNEETPNVTVTGGTFTPTWPET